MKIQKPMKIRTNYSILSLTISVCLFLLIGCKKTNEAPPFPVLESEFAQPGIKNLTIPQPDTLNWVTENIPELKSLPITKFDWDKLPSKPFDIGISYPLKGTATSSPFDLDSLPNTPFSLDSLPQTKLTIKVSVLGNPKIAKAGSFNNEPSATRGVMTADAGFGLPTTPYCQMTDSNDIIWFGLNNGVASYDSENLETYDIEQGLEAKYVNWIFEDSKGRLWMVGNQGSISVMDKKSNLVYEIKSSLNLRRIFTIIEDKNGLFWLANDANGFLIINFEEKTMYQFDSKKGLLADSGFQIYEDKEGFLLLSTFEGVNVIDPERTKNYSLNSVTATMFFTDNQGRLWSTAYGGVQFLNPSRTSLSFLSAENLGIPEILMTSVFQDHSGNFYFGTRNGMLLKYDEETGLITKFIVRATATNNQWVGSIEEKTDGSIWVAIANGGIFKIDVNGARPGNYRTESGIGDNNVWATLEARDGKMWIGTHNGIDVYDPIEKTLKHLGEEQGLGHPRNTNLTEDSKGRIWAGGGDGMSIIDPVEGTIRKLTTEEGMKSQRISSSELALDGSIWTSSFTGEIQNINYENSTIKSFIDKDSLVGKSRKDRVIMTDPNTIWVASREFGLQKMDLSKNLRWQFSMDNGLISNDLNSIKKDDKNHIWIVTDRGVQMLDEKNQIITTFKVAEGLAVNDVYDVVQKEGKIYLGTSKGLTILEPLEGDNTTIWKAKTIGKDQGMDYIDFCQNSISFDKNGTLWAGVEGQMLTVMDEIVKDTTQIPARITSINIFDKQLTFKNKQLLQEKNIENDTLIKHTQNRSKIDSSYQTLNNITWGKVDGPYKLPVGLTLPSDQNYLSFNFNGGQFGNPNNVIYRYILEGIDKNWSAVTDKTTSENYRDLPPGDYTFKLASKGFNGIWSQPAKISFAITPPWWQTWWAYLGYLIVLGLLAKQVHNYQKAKTVRIEREKSREKDLAQAKEIEKAYTELKATQSQLIQSEKMASLGELTAGIAHEIQNPLNFVKNFSEVSTELIDEMVEDLKSGKQDEVMALAQEIKENQERINHHGKRAGSIVKGMLQHSRSSSGERVSTDINTLCDEYLRLSYHGLRAKDKSFNADLQTELAKDIPKIEVVSQDLGRVLLNLINNAFYAVKEMVISSGKDFKPLVKVSTKLIDNYIEITVSDNGNGIPDRVKDKIFQPFFTTKPAGKGTGLGLSLSYDIIKAHGGKLKVETQEGEGTQFKIILPV